MCALLTCCVFSLCLCGSGLGESDTCSGVHDFFKQRQIGPNHVLPSSPRSGSELQVCTSKSLTCCTKKMEEKYQSAARRDVQNLSQTYSSRLKSLLSSHVAAFQETFEASMRQAENHTNIVLQVSYQKIADRAASSVRELFTDVGLFSSGSELNVEEFVQRFFDALLPSVYNDYIHPGVSDSSPGYSECVRSLNRIIKPFGAVPDLLADQIATSGVSGKLSSQASHLGIEVINTTDHLQSSRECRRASLKMQYCPHCQGITHSKPCMGYCSNVMRGCSASMAEIDAHWREFVRSSEGSSGRMHGAHDLEQVLSGAHTMLHDAIGHAQKNGPHLAAQVHRLCSTPDRKPAQSVSIHDTNSRVSIPLKASNRQSDDSSSDIRKDFSKTSRTFSTFYGGSADQMCLQELSSGDGVPCWNGTNIVKSYTRRVVGNGVRAQSTNPEVKVKGEDPVINQIIDKLRHINQLLQGKTIPKSGSSDQIETGSGDSEGHYSGDCDDEDGCAGSGGSESNRKISKMSPDVTSDYKHHHYHHPPAKDSEINGNSHSLRSTAATWVLVLPCLHMSLDL